MFFSLKLTNWKQLESVPGEAKVHDVGEKGTKTEPVSCHVLHYRTINYRYCYEFETYILILMLQTP